MSETNEVRTPYLREDGSLCIPMDGDPKYFHWKPDGQTLEKTLLELNAPYETLVKYLGQLGADKIQAARDEQK